MNRGYFVAIKEKVTSVLQVGFDDCEVVLYNEFADFIKETIVPDLIEGLGNIKESSGTVFLISK